MIKNRELELKMKKLLVIALAAFAMVSCAKDVETDVQKWNIDFATSTKYVNRSVVATTDNLEKFYVWAYTNQDEDVMANQVVNKSGDAWTYTPKKYWPVDRTVDFFAIYPLQNDILSDDSDASLIRKHILTPTITATEAHFRFRAQCVMDNNYNIISNTIPDIIYATAIGKSKANTNGQPVLMKFRHALAQVAFAIENNTTAANGVTVVSPANIIIGKLKEPDSYTLPTAGSTSDATPAQGTWSYIDEVLDWEFATTPNVSVASGEVVSISDVNDACFVVPQTGTDVTFTIPVVIKQQGLTIMSGLSAKIDIDWKEGYRYIYTFEITDATLEKNIIEFTANVVPIEDVVEDNIVF